MNSKITFLTNKDIKIVKKPWGSEKWLADGFPEFKYALKEIFFRAPHKTSLQFHKQKEETDYFLKGKGIFHYSETIIDIKKYENGLYSNEEINKIINNLSTIEIVPGTIIHVKPGGIHRVESIEDLIMIEASTMDLDDVVRLQDDFGRPDGHIKNEHSE
tara:strand:- start:561 stop:1037 length:477 start_codon:yes stop_codon:yes gene_type:complete